MDHIIVGSKIFPFMYMIFTKNILIIFQVTEEALRLASTQQTNTTKVATIHLQKLEAQVTDLTRERDQLAEKNARISHEYTLQSKAMGNLNSALEGFQNQKENEMKWAEKDFDGRYAFGEILLL